MPNDHALRTRASPGRKSFASSFEPFPYSVCNGTVWTAKVVTGIHSGHFGASILALRADRLRSHLASGSGRFMLLVPSPMTLAERVTSDHLTLVA